MAYSPTVYDGDGAQTDFTFAWAYISTSHVKVYVSGVDTAYTWVTASTVRVSPAPAAGTGNVVIKRVTPTDPIITWADGSIVLAASLNTSATQSLYIAEEAKARAAESLIQDPATFDWDADTHKIINVVDPTSAQDAATKAYVDTQDAATLAATAANAAAALASETAAAASETAAAASETAAAASAAAADASATSAAASVVAAASAYDQFDDRFLGDKASDPTLDNDGNALLTGALYFNTTIGKMKVYTGSAWQLAFNDTAAASAITNDSGVSGATVAAALNTLDTGLSGKAPSTSGTAILKGDGSGGFSSAAAGTDYAAATSGTSVLKGDGSGGTTAAAVTDLGAGWHTVWVPAAALTPDATYPPQSAEYTGSNRNYGPTLKFDASVVEIAWGSFALPESWNASTISFAPVWISYNTGAVVWDLHGDGLSDSDPYDPTLTYICTSTSTISTIDDVVIGPESSGTIGNSPAKSDFLSFRIARNATSGSDTLADDAVLLGLLFYIQTDALTDA